MLAIGFLSVVLVRAGVFALLALSVQLQFGYGGLLNFGAVASMLVAAYTMAIAVIHLHLELWIAGLIGLAASAVLGVLIALPTLRLRAIYLGFASIAVAEILRYLAMNLTPITGGPIGTIGMLGSSTTATYNDAWYAFEDQIVAWIEAMSGGDVSRDVAMAIVTWLVVLLCLALLHGLIRSPWGRTLKAIRDNEDVAAAMGKNVFGYKLAALVIGSVVAGVGGLLQAWHLSAFSPSDFLPVISFYGFVIVLLSGTGRMWAVPIGAVLFASIFSGTRFLEFWPFTVFDSIDRQYIRLLAIGVILVVVMLVRPQGMFGRKEEALL